MTEPEDPGARPVRRNVLVDVAAWVAAIAFCLGLPALAAIAWVHIADPVGKIREGISESVRPVPGVDTRGPVQANPACNTPILSAEEFDAFAKLTDRGTGAGERTAPRWKVRPRPEFPQQMLRAGVESGEVRLKCLISETGETKACHVVSDSAPGLGMPEAVVAAMCDARMDPTFVDGEPKASTITFTINFQMAQVPRR